MTDTDLVGTTEQRRKLDPAIVFIKPRGVWLGPKHGWGLNRGCTAQLPQTMGLLQPVGLDVLLWLLMPLGTRADGRAL